MSAKVHDSETLAMSFNADLLKPTASFWDAAAQTYEHRFTGTTVGRIRRQAVWQALERIFKPCHHVLELNLRDRAGRGLSWQQGCQGRGIRYLSQDDRTRHEHSDRVRPATLETNTIHPKFTMIHGHYAAYRTTSTHDEGLPQVPPRTRRAGRQYRKIATAVSGQPKALSYLSP